MISFSKLQNPKVQPASLILLFGLLLVFIPHFSHLPLWLSFVMFGLLIWRGAFELQLCAIPKKFVLFLLTIMLLTGIFYSYHTLIGRDAGSAMLLGLLCLKLFEIKSFRDVVLIINLALFSIVINFLFDQTIPIAFIMLFALLFLFSALISFQHDYKKLSSIQHIPLNLIRKNEKQHFKLAFKMLAQALPFAIVLFILFPRVDGPLWGLPEDAFSGTTGLSDKMSPGKISHLSNDSSVAFRVKFDSEIPPANELYWRGPVMWHFNGYDWTAPAEQRVAINEFKFTGLNKVTNYSITLQPHNNYWMLALDIPSILPAKSILTTDMQVLSVKPVQKLKRYKLSSYTKYILPQKSNVTMQRYLKLPKSFGTNLSRSKKLIETLKDSQQPENTIKNVLNYFSTQNFYYSRKPPLLYNNPIDEFLFDTKRGYCEHYASSFTVLMRLAGIPSRVVTGYQGGVINPIDNFMTVRQSDAHAWSEVFINNKGWIRVDPTAVIPPGNIENSDDAARLNSTFKKPSGLFKINWLTTQARQMRFAWDAVNNSWNQWVIGYNNKKQKAFFEAIGIPEITWQGLSQLLFSILGVLTALLAFIVFSKQSKSIDKTQKAYFKFLKKMKKQGLIKEVYEGADDFSNRAIIKLPKNKTEIQIISNLYQRLRYGHHSDIKLQSLKKQINAFHIK